MTDSPANPITRARVVAVVLAIWVAFAIVSLPSRLDIMSDYAELGSEGRPNSPAVPYDQLTERDVRLAVITIAAAMVVGICLLSWFHRARGNAKRQDTRLSSQLSRPLLIWWSGLTILTLPSGVIITLLVIRHNLSPYTPGQGQIETAHALAICQVLLTLTGVLTALLTIRAVRQVTAYQQRTRS